MCGWGGGGGGLGEETEGAWNSGRFTALKAVFGICSLIGT